LNRLGVLRFDGRLDRLAAGVDQFSDNDHGLLLFKTLDPRLRGDVSIVLASTFSLKPSACS
jgi:hypothetical protein